MSSHENQLFNYCCHFDFYNHPAPFLNQMESKRQKRIYGNDE